MVKLLVFISDSQVFISDSNFFFSNILESCSQNPSESLFPPWIDVHSVVINEFPKWKNASF